MLLVTERLETVVGRGGLEPPTSALGRAECCANESGSPSVGRRVMWCGQKAETRRVPAAALTVW